MGFHTFEAEEIREKATNMWMSGPESILSSCVRIYEEQLFKTAISSNPAYWIGEKGEEKVWRGLKKDRQKGVNLIQQ
jgi:hypothetical protein